MKEITIILYILIMQLNAAAITAGILSYLRYKKESLKYFILIIVSLQVILVGILIKTIIVYTGKENSLLDGIFKCFDLSGTALLLFVITIFPFFMAGRKPSRMIKKLVGLLPLSFLTNSFLSFIPEYIIINKLIIVTVLLTIAFTILAAIRSIAVKPRAIAYIIGMFILFVPYLLMKSPQTGFSMFQELLFAKPLYLPVYLLITSFCSLLLIKTYFNVPFFINPENGALSDYFIEKFNITGREAEIIMLLRKGKAYKEIAEDLTIAYKTVDAHIQNIYSKTGVNSRKQLINLIEAASI